MRPTLGYISVTPVQQTILKLQWHKTRTVLLLSLVVLEFNQGQRDEFLSGSHVVVVREWRGKSQLDSCSFACWLA